MSNSRPQVFYKNRPNNLLPGEPAPPTKRVDAEKLLENFDSIFRALGIAQAFGGDALNGNSNGLSTATQCNLTIKNDQGNNGLLDVQDWVYISDGESIWGKFTQDSPATAGNDEISFSDDNLLLGSGPQDYSQADFIDRLTIIISKFPLAVGRDQINLTPGSPGGLTAEAIALSSAEPTDLNSFVTELKGRVDTVVDLGGGLKSNVITTSAIHPDGFKFTSTKNLVPGGFHRDSNQDGVADGAAKLNGGSGQYSLDSVNKKIGNYSQKVISSTGGVGIQFNISEFGALCGETISVACWVRVTSQKARITVYDGVSTHSSEELGSPGVWVRGAFTCPVDSAAQMLVVRLESTAADTQYYDGVMVTCGEIPWAYEESDDEKIADDSLIAVPVNLLPNASFDDFSRGTDTLPDGWMFKGLPPESISRDGDNKFFGRYSCLVDLKNGEGIKQVLADEVCQLTQGKSWILSGWIKKSSSAGTDATIRIGTLGDGAVYETFNPASFADWTLVVVKGSGKITTVYIENIGGTDHSKFNLDGLQLYLGDKVTQGLLACAFDYIPVMFSASSVSADAYMNGPGGFAGDGFNLGMCSYIWRLTVSANVGPSGDAIIKARRDGLDTGVDTHILTGTTFGQDATDGPQFSTFFDLTDRISVYCDMNAGTMLSVRATVTFLSYKL
jgi:hypothetical protein